MTRSPQPSFCAQLLRAAASGSLALALAALPAPRARASDHTDAPVHNRAGLDARRDAQITDFWAFVSDEGSHRDGGHGGGGPNLVLVMGVNPFIPASLHRFRFPSDVTYRIALDVDSPVRIDGSAVTRAFGGVIPRPDRIREDLTFEVRFDRRNQPQLRVRGVSSRKEHDILTDPETRFFSGLRADGFIFGPFYNRNIAAIVIETPLRHVLEDSDKILAWATTDVDDPDFSAVSPDFQELAGRSLRSQSGEFEGFLNSNHPRDHKELIDAAYPNGSGLPAGTEGFSDVPDVLILDTSRPTRFPNGRLMTDDVVDLIAHLRAPYADTRIKGAEPKLCRGDVQPARFLPEVVTANLHCVPTPPPGNATDPETADYDVNAHNFPGGIPAGLSNEEFPYLGRPHGD